MSLLAFKYYKKAYSRLNIRNVTIAIIGYVSQGIIPNHSVNNLNQLNISSLHILDMHFLKVSTHLNFSKLHLHGKKQFRFSPIQTRDYNLLIIARHAAAVAAELFETRKILHFLFWLTFRDSSPKSLDPFWFNVENLTVW